MKKIPEDLAEKLLKASNRFPDGQGFDVSIDEVAQLSGVPRATMYYYFSGKDDLVEFYLNDLMNRTREAIQKAAATVGPASDRLSAVMKAIIGAFARYPRMCLDLPGAIGDAESHATLMANMDRSVLTPLREVLLEGRGAGDVTFTDANVAADAIMGALHMVSIKALLTDGSIDVDSLSESVVPQLCDGLLVR